MSGRELGSMAESVESNIADPNIDYERQWWEKLDPYHRQKVRCYLGKLVDCSKPVKSEEWWRCLDTNDLPPTREIAEGAKNLQVNPRASAGSQSEETKNECRTEYDGSSGITPYKSIKVEGGFHLKRVIKTSSKSSTEYKDKDTITFRQGLSKDILNEHGHTKFEVELCEYLLGKIDSTLTKEIKDIERVQEATEEHVTVKRKLQSAKTKLDDVLKKTEYQDFVARFEAFVKNNEEIWGMVADACYFYFARDDFCSTHYIHCITLGTAVHQSETSENIINTTTVSADVKGSDYVDAGGKITKEMDRTRESITTLTRGTEDKMEVTAVTTRAVSNLISDKSDDSSRLKLVVAKLIKSLYSVNEGMQSVVLAKTHTFLVS